MAAIDVKGKGGSVENHDQSLCGPYSQDKVTAEGLNPDHLSIKRIIARRAASAKPWPPTIDLCTLLPTCFGLRESLWPNLRI